MSKYCVEATEVSILTRNQDTCTPLETTVFLLDLFGSSWSIKVGENQPRNPIGRKYSEINRNCPCVTPRRCRKGGIVMRLIQFISRVKYTDESKQSGDALPQCCTAN